MSALALEGVLAYFLARWWALVKAQVRAAGMSSLTCTTWAGLGRDAKTFATSRAANELANELAGEPPASHGLTDHLGLGDPLCCMPLCDSLICALAAWPT